MGRPRKHPLAPKGISGKLPVVPRRKDSIFTYTAVELDKAREQLAAALEDRRVLQEQLIQAEDHIDEVAESMDAAFDQERKGLFAALDRSHEFIAAVSKTNVDLSYRLEKALLDRGTFPTEKPPAGETRRRANRPSNWIASILWVLAAGAIGLGLLVGILDFLGQLS